MVQTPPPSRRRRKRRILAWIAVGTLACLLLLYLARDVVLAGPLGSLVGQRLSRALGTTITVERVEGDWFTGLTLVGARMRQPGAEGPLRDLSWARLTLDYRLATLLRDPLAGITAITADDLRLDIDPTRRRPDMPTTGADPLATLLANLPRQLPRIAVGGTLLLRTPYQALHAEGLRVDGGGRDLALSIASLRLGESPPQAFAARLALTDQGGVALTASEPLLGIVPRDLRLQPAPGGPHLVAALGIGSATCRIEWQAERLALTLQRLDLAALPSWLVAALPPRATPERGVVDVRLRLARIAGDATASTGVWPAWATAWAMDARVEADGVRWAGIEMERADLVAGWDGGRLDCQRLDLRGPLLGLRVRGASWDGEAGSAPLAARIEASCPDLAALLGTAMPAWQARLQGHPPLALALAGMANGERIVLERLALDGAGLRLRGSGGAGAAAGAAWDWNALEGECDLELEADLATVVPALSGAPPASGPATPPTWSGRLAARLRAHGPLAAPALICTATIPDLACRGQPGSFAATLRQDDAGLRLERLELAAGEAMRARAEGTWPLRVGVSGLLPATLPARLAVHGRIPELADVLPASLPVRGAIALDLLLDPARADGQALTGHGTVTGLRVQPRTDDGIADEQAPASAPVDLDLRLDAGRSGVHARLTGSGESGDLLAGELALEAAVAVDEPASWMRLLDAPASGRMRCDRLPLASITALVPGLLRLSGDLSGEVLLAGTPRQPRTTGSLAIADGALRLRNALAPIDRLNGSVRFSGPTWTIEGLTFAMGRSPLTVSGGGGSDPRGMPTFDLALEGRNALVVQNRHLRLRADLALTLRGSLDQLVAAGDIAITDALYSQRMELLSSSSPGADDKLQLFSLRDGPLSGLRFQLTVRGRESLRIDNNLLQAECSLELAIGGSGAVPVPDGRIEMRGARLTLPFSTLAIERGELRFSRDAPFDPHVDVSARTRMRGYRLAVHASGPSSRVEIVVTSTPPLPQDEALLLLTTGATSTELERSGLERAALSRVGSYLGMELVRRAAGPGDPDAESVIDRIEVNLGEEVSRSGVETLETEFRLDDRDRARLFLQGERDRYDAYNLGVVYRFNLR